MHGALARNVENRKRYTIVCDTNTLEQCGEDAIQFVPILSSDGFSSVNAKRDSALESRLTTAHFGTTPGRVPLSQQEALLALAANARTTTSIADSRQLLRVRNDGGGVRVFPRSALDVKILSGRKCRASIMGSHYKEKHDNRKQRFPPPKVEEEDLLFTNAEERFLHEAFKFPCLRDDAQTPKKAVSVSPMTSSEKARQRFADVLSTPSPSMSRKRPQSFDGPPEELEDSPTVARLGSRADNSLLILTQKFLDLLVENKVVNLNDAAAILQVPKRRLYDITNVLDGIDVVNKTGKNSISLKNPTNIKQSVDRARAMINQDINSTDPLLSAAARPAERSQHSAALAAERARGRELDRVLNDVNRAINLVKESPVDRTHCYLSYDEIRQQVNIPSPVLVAVKPPSGTTTDITVSSFAETGKHAALFKNKEGQALTLWGIGGAAPAMNAAPPVVQPVQMPTAASQQVKQEYCDFAVPYPPQSELYQPQAQQASATAYPQPTLNTLSMDMQPLRTEDFSPMRMQSFTYDNPAMPSTSFMGNDMSNQLQPFNYDDMASFRNGNDVVLPTASNGSFNVPIITPSKLLPLGTSSLLISPLKTLIETETPGANIIAHGFNSFDDQSMMPSITLGDIYEESMWSMNNPLHLG